MTNHKWNIADTKTDKVANYVGFKTKKEAKEFARDWNKRHNDIKVYVVMVA